MNNLLFGIDISKVERYSIFCINYETLEMIGIQCDTLTRVQIEFIKLNAEFGAAKLGISVLCHMKDGSTEVFKFPGVKEQTLEEMKVEIDDVLKRLVEKINVEGWEED
jgi:hypothetical protein